MASSAAVARQRVRRNDFAFVCHLQRVVSKHLTRCLNFGLNRNGLFVHLDLDIACGGELVKRARKTPSRGVAEAAHMGRGIEHCGNEVIKRRCVAFHGGREGEALALAHHGDAVVAKRARDKNDIARLARSARKRTASGTSPTPAVLM